ncbi:hypothetical protein AJ80_07433 [Polytolypa hystricis UAMH7299]|uniref:chitinase n=1 Tax=Polytolypa hystricis (strain UAMH7299) TaxID=1447883 RepID=A0A2B7XQA2_POLH7|nr:hypothetical protein AJ80_07433 [Polytolypa hystricis UAMH7299]
MKLLLYTAAALWLVIQLVSSQSSPFDPCPIHCNLAGPNPSNWTHLHGQVALTRCPETVIFDLAVYTPVLSPTAHLTFRACTASEATTSHDMEYKPTPFAFGLKSRATDSSSHCVGEESTYQNKTDVHLMQWGSSKDSGSPGEIASVVSALNEFVLLDLNCGPTILFARSGNAVVGLYVGGEIEKGSAAAILKNFVDTATNLDSLPEQLALQICRENSPSPWIMGLYVDPAGNISAVQDAVANWSDAKCFTNPEDEDIWKDTDISVIKAIDVPIDLGLGSGFEQSSTPARRSLLRPRAECTAIQVASGDGCWSLSERCGITQDELLNYNGGGDFCDTLIPAQWVCCSTGTLPDFSPQPNPNGSCASYAAQTDDYCFAIAEAHHITVDDIESYNGDTWGWAGCDGLQPGQKICLSTGAPPMPAAIENAVCGPQVPGTESVSGTELADLNPCPLNVCCNIWGQCGITEDFCIESPADTGAPGTSQPGANGCISNCGMEMVNNDVPPASFSRIAYFEAWNQNRPCLHMDVNDIDTNLFTHIHFAFGDITPDFHVDVSPVQEQFDIMKDMGRTGIKRILSFGGWAFSTEAPTYSIFRDGVTPANRQTFANNVVNFINTHNLDGVDFDWEYPAAPDIPGIPAGQLQEGQDYLDFLTIVKAQLPDKSVSIAAPASYWYLKGYPIEEIGAVVDYMVYMTYDLHGQWDYGNKWSTPGCEEGNCLRSHVNKTETESALIMITKAGVPSHKVFAGISSYGRSFKMAEAGCTGPDCQFTGSANVSDAAGGPCTDTGGYIAAAEIRDIIRRGGNVNTWYDQSSDSDIVVYNDLEWVAWMNDETKSNRIGWYRGLNFGGVSDWAVDLDAGGLAVRHLSPQSATVIPFPATSVASTVTFTAGGAVATDIDSQPNDGKQNTPSGPGPSQCGLCDFIRLITSTCCGYGGGVSNPIEISPNYDLPRNLILPRGFTPNQEMTDARGLQFPSGVPLPEEIIIPRGTRFSSPLVMPRGMGLSNTFTDPETIDDDDDDDDIIYITSTFWDGPHTVSCSPPCTLLFPPTTTTSTWTPPPFTTTVSGTTTIVNPPVQTTQQIRISKETVNSETGSPATKTIFPTPAPAPLCIEITLPIVGTLTFGLCPPDINPFPPPVPSVVVVPVPPDGKSGPTNPGNQPSEEQEEEEEEEDNEKPCPYTPSLDPDDPIFGDDGSWRPTSGPPLPTGTGTFSKVKVRGDEVYGNASQPLGLRSYF